MMPSAESTSPIPSEAIRSLADIREPAVCAYLERRMEEPDTLGILLCGSRVTGWAAPDGDYDAFIYVTDDRYRSLSLDETQVRLMAEGETPRRMLGDFSVFSDEVFQSHLVSPLDIDHWPYVDAVALADRTGALEAWRRRLAAFPESERKDRALQKYIQLAIAYHYAILDDARGFAADRQLNLYRAALCGVHLWFALQGRWAPPLKWWTREVERLSIRPDTRGILEAAILNPTLDTLTLLRDHLKTEMRAAGIAEVDDLQRAFFATFLPERHETLFRHTYL